MNDLKEKDKIDLLEPEPYRSVIQFESDMEKTKEFYDFLRGKRDEFERLELEKPFTPEQAFRIIYLLHNSKRFNFIPEWIEQCDVCKKLYDIDKDEGNNVESFFDSVIWQISGLTEKQRYHLDSYVNSFFNGGIKNFCNEHRFAWEKSLLIFLKDATEGLYPFAAILTDWTTIESKK